MQFMIFSLRAASALLLAASLSGAATSFAQTPPAPAVPVPKPAPKGRDNSVQMSASDQQKGPLTTGATQTPPNPVIPDPRRNLPANIFSTFDANQKAQAAKVSSYLSSVQTLIGNFVQPRMTSDSLNLSAVVMLLALSIWGAIWGLAGAFLAAPLTVMLMIVLAQFQGTRWIAILLSADGRPTPELSHLSKSDSGPN